MSAPAPTPAPAQVVWVLAGLLLGAALYFAFNALYGLLFAPSCSGVIWRALIPPFVLGPGGLVLLVVWFGRPRGRSLAMGLVLASLFPALGLGAMQIGQAREAGCGGAYLSLVSERGRTLSRIVLPAGKEADFSASAGGFPETETVRWAADAPAGVSVRFSPPVSAPGQVVQARVSLAPDTASNEYTVTIIATPQSALPAQGSFTLLVTVP